MNIKQMIKSKVQSQVNEPFVTKTSNPDIVMSRVLQRTPVTPG